MIIIFVVFSYLFSILSLRVILIIIFSKFELKLLHRSIYASNFVFFSSYSYSKLIFLIERTFNCSKTKCFFPMCHISSCIYTFIFHRNNTIKATKYNYNTIILLCVRAHTIIITL